MFCCRSSLIASLALLLPFGSPEQVTINIDSHQDGQSPTNFLRSLGGSLYSTRFEGIAWDNDRWTLTTETVQAHDYHSQAFIANGYIGLAMAAAGPFFQAFGETELWPLYDDRQTFGTVSGFFDREPKLVGGNFPWLDQYGLETAISGLPHWSGLIVELDDGQYLDANVSATQLSDIVLTQDYKQGLAQWEYTWTPENAGNLSFEIAYTAFASKLAISQAWVELQISATEDCNVTIANVIDGRGGLRTNFVKAGFENDLIYSSVSPIGVSEVDAYIYSGIANTELGTPKNLGPGKAIGKKYVGANESSIAQTLSLPLKAGQVSQIAKYVGIASTDAFQDPQSQARNAALAAKSKGFKQSLDEHIKEWATVFSETSISDYSDPSTGSLPASPDIIEKAIVQVVSVFALLTNTIGANAMALVHPARPNVNGISVGGLFSQAYAGLLFWDQDVWMAPYLAAVFPFEAHQVSNARVQKYPMAKENLKTAYQSSKNTTSFSPNGAIYPWTSGRDGNCTDTGPCWDYEMHINTDIVKSSVTLWAASGDTEYMKDNTFDIMQSIATMLSDALVKNGSTYSLTNITDPDEYANHVDNGGFTMPSIAFVFNSTNFFRQQFGQARNASWDERMLNLAMPTEDGISLEYANMNGSIAVKQADVVLKIYPLAVTDNYPISNQLADLDYYAGKQSPDGPGMTYAIFSIDASDISPSGCSSFTYDVESWSPYLRAPWYLFSEQLGTDVSYDGGTNLAYPFVTGHGGALQVDLFGYLGLRYSADFSLALNPMLPPQIPFLAYPVFHFQGWPFKAQANATHTTIQRLANQISTANQTFAHTPITVHVGRENATTYHLAVNQIITVANRAFVHNATVPGNILQCETQVTSPDPYQPGLFPMGAIDGAISTVWQPTTANASHSITVDLSDVRFQPLTSAYFDWAQAPPYNATITLHNQSSPETSPGRVTIALTNITISNPYDVQQANVVRAYLSNTTNVTFHEPVWSGNFATLTVVGNQNGTNGPNGATVAEWALVGSV